MAETVVMTLTEFLLARIAEDREVAQDIMSAPSWHISPNDFERILDNDGEWVAESMVGTVAHIARHDPAHVLAECDAKRRIVEWCGGAAQWLLDPDRSEYDEAPIDYSGEVHMAAAVLRALALPYAEHPDYDEAWRP